jgi:hypothetical protein
VALVQQCAADVLQVVTPQNLVRNVGLRYGSCGVLEIMGRVRCVEKSLLGQKNQVHYS